MKKQIFLLALVVTFFCACKEKNQPEEGGGNGNDPSTSITCAPTTKTVASAGDEFVVTLKSTASWTASVNKSWVAVNPNSGQGDAYVTITIAAGETDTANVLFSNGEGTAKLVIARLEGALRGKFTINANGDQVQFSKGNLQATTNDYGRKWTWSFAANQYDTIGCAGANRFINENGKVTLNGTVDLFGWSTAATYFGINKSENESDYAGDFVDWGTNAISNGGNTPNLWRTLTHDEWYYLINTRKNAANLQGQATVNGVPGYVLLVDGFEAPTGLSFTATPNNWTTNVYDVADWAKMEAVGAVFLPAAGERSGSVVFSVGESGGYWSATPNSSSKAYEFSYNEAVVTPNLSISRYYGNSVRLVRVVD